MTRALVPSGGGALQRLAARVELRSAERSQQGGLTDVLLDARGAALTTTSYRPPHAHLDGRREALV